MKKVRVGEKLGSDRSVDRKHTFFSHMKTENPGGGGGEHHHFLLSDNSYCLNFTCIVLKINYVTPPPINKRGGGSNKTKFKGGVYQKKGTKTKNQGGRELKVTGDKTKCTCKEGGGVIPEMVTKTENRGGREVNCEKKSRGVIIYLFFF